MRKHRRPLAALTAMVVTVCPSAAQAANKSVFAGPPRPVKSLPESVDLAHFFPKKIKVAQGQSIDFHFRGFHTITFLGKADMPALFIPDGQKISGAQDAAGNPFWFNGADRLVMNNEAGGPVGDGKVDNRAMENSGLPQGDEPEPYTLHFPKRGTFKYLCLIHPRMRGKVTVLRKGRRVPSARRDEMRIAEETAKLVRTAKRRAAFEGPGGAQIRAGNDTDDVEVMRFFPESVTVRAGETVRWFQRHPNEFHTVTFGPEDYLRPLGEGFIAPDTTAPQGGPPTLVLNPLAAFTSDAPSAGVPSYDGANHGNGFLNSGVLDVDPGTPSPAEFRARFTRAGTYRFLCLVHGPDMSGTVTVTG